MLTVQEQENGFIEIKPGGTEELDFRGRGFSIHGEPEVEDCVPVCTWI